MQKFFLLFAPVSCFHSTLSSLFTSSSHLLCLFLTKLLFTLLFTEKMEDEKRILCCGLVCLDIVTVVRFFFFLNCFFVCFCFLFSVLYSLFYVLCSLFSVLRSLFSVLCSLLSVVCSLFSVLCSLFSVLCFLFSVLC